MNTQKALTLLAAVLLAISMWFFVISRGQSDVSIEVPVLFNNVPAGLTLSDRSDKSVTLTVKGHDSQLQELRSEDISVTLNANKLKMGNNKVPMSDAEVKLPGTLRVATIKPRYLTLFAEETMHKDVLIKVVLSGLPLEGYTTRLVDVNPKKVKVSGVKSQIMDLKVVYTEPVEIAGANSTVTETVKLRLDGKSFTAEPTSVDVKVMIVKERF